MDISTAANTAAVVDLAALCRNSGGANGPLWSTETDDLDLTLLSWDAGRQIAPHVNSEVDVVVVAVEGEGVITVEGTEHRCRAGQALIIPKGAERSYRAVGERFGYLSLHKRRQGLQITRRPARP